MKDLAAKVIIGFFLVCILIIALIVSYLNINHPATAVHIVKNHLMHYSIGLGLWVVLSAIFFKKFTLQQHVIYFGIPSLIAAGWPDIVYFISYVLQEGTYIGVLGARNKVYSFMHQPLAALSASPVMSSLVFLYDTLLREKDQAPKYWILITIALTVISSVSHVYTDLHFGF